MKMYRFLQIDEIIRPTDEFANPNKYNMDNVDGSFWEKFGNVGCSVFLTKDHWIARREIDPITRQDIASKTKTDEVIEAIWNEEMFDCDCEKCEKLKEKIREILK